MNAERPTANPGDEQYALMRVGPDWRTMPPDEWIARRIHEFMLWGWADFTFADTQFNAWMDPQGRDLH